LTAKARRCYSTGLTLPSVLRSVLFTGFVVLTLPILGQAPIQIPSDETKWDIKRNNDGHQAPPGYEGRTDTATVTAVGKVPETAGQSIVATMTLANQIRTCPYADGTADGTGEYSMKIKHTNAGSTVQIEMSMKAKYKGQVGDDALLEGPVKGEMDYTYTVTENTRNKNGALTSPAVPSTPQHISIPIVVEPNQAVTNIGPFSGGDPSKGHYSEAVTTGLALGYWAGIYYSVAQTKWYGGEVRKGYSDARPGLCVDVVFDPPGNTLQPPLGTETRVNAVVKTKSGETVPARFVDAKAHSGFVEPSNGLSVVGTPLRFAYTALKQKSSSAGFAVGAFSRAGTAVGEWKTGLGTGWSGQISYMKQSGGDQGSDDYQTWSSSGVTRITITVKDGIGTMDAYIEQKSRAENRQKVAGGGFIMDTSSSGESTGGGTKPIELNVSISQDKSSYGIGITDPHSGRPEPVKIIGKSTWSQCNRYNCSSGSNDIYMPGLPPMDPLGGKLQDVNHIQASREVRKDNLGRSKKGWMVETMTVNLARSGTSK